MDRGLTYHDVVLPGRVIGELYPGADRVEVVLGKHNSFPEPDHDYVIHKWFLFQLN